MNRPLTAGLVAVIVAALLLLAGFYWFGGVQQAMRERGLG